MGHGKVSIQVEVGTGLHVKYETKNRFAFGALKANEVELKDKNEK